MEWSRTQRVSLLLPWLTSQLSPGPRWFLALTRPPIPRGTVGDQHVLTVLQAAATRTQGFGICMYRYSGIPPNPRIPVFRCGRPGIPGILTLRVRGHINYKRPNVNSPMQPLYRQS